MYRSLTRLTALLMVALGLTMLVVTAWHGGGVGILLGVLFVLAGAGRLWLLRRRA
ncbi:MAG TPA: hypothetical protein VFK17_09645 [Gaiellaceae bacterium]|jgi:hypothetical protein|nr:hypothetical protein [Gaiellaceae bacterium]